MQKNRTIHDLFDIENEISSYILGFWLADGNIFLSHTKSRPRKQKAFALYNTDRDLMYEIGSIFGKVPRVRKRNDKNKDCYNIKIKSDKLFDFCYNITNSTSKSDKYIKIPVLKKENQSHFIRGLFDGDGSINIKSYKTRHGKVVNALQSSFAAGKDTGKFLEDVRDMIRNHVPVGLKKICGKENRALIFNQYDTMLLCDWMYKDATIYMKRKREIFDSFDRERLLRSQKFFSNKV